jgi:hypothetical protein
MALESMTFLRWRVAVDHLATTVLYTHRRAGYDCTCGSCQAFNAGLDRLPQVLLETLILLGVDGYKPFQVSSVDRGDPRGEFYMVAYPVVGMLLDQAPETSAGVTLGGADLRIVVHNGVNVPGSDPIPNQAFTVEWAGYLNSEGL